MTRAFHYAVVALVGAFVAACGNSTREPVPITPPAEVAKAPVARTAMTPPAAAPGPPPSLAAIAPPPKIDVLSFPSGAIYVCASGAGAERKLTAIEFDAKVGDLCRRHPEMGPCQYERDICRRSGGRVYAANGTEITPAIEAEYDKKVSRTRFKSN